MPTIKIHRGTHQIGGTITEISTTKVTIFIDFGSELSVEPENSTDGRMIEMINNHVDCKGIFFTHYHGDHVGLLAEIPGDVPIYMGETARKILLNIRSALLKAAKNSHAEIAGIEKVKKEFAILKDDSRVKTFSDNDVINVADEMTIIPHMVDHSAFDAYMFQIEADGKTILHSGDFRMHGRLAPIIMPRLEKRLKNVRVDVLLIEGTMMSRMDEKVLTEDEMMREAIGLLLKPENKYSFLLCSSTNMDSLASFCFAAHKLKRPFLVNEYVYKQIMLYRESAAGLHRIYSFPRVYEITRNLEKLLPNGQSQEAYMREHGFLMLTGQTAYYEKLMAKFKGDDLLLIYSLWNGYLNEEDNLNRKDRLIELTRKYRCETLHTSGHATADAIAGFIKMVKPEKAIIPIHTEHREAFGRLDIGAYQEKVVCMEDGNEWTFDD